MITEPWIDVSNFTQPFSQGQLGFLKDNYKGVIIGLQNSDKARAFQQQVISIGLERGYYIDLPGRDLSIPEDGSYCAIDIEVDCFTDSGDIDRAILDLDAELVRVMIYGNETSIVPVIGNSEALSKYPLWWANYGTPDPSRFRPFNGWEKPLLMQYSPEGIQGINCDLDLLILDDPVPPEPYLTHTIQVFSDGSVNII